MWKEEAMAYFHVIFRHFPEGKIYRDSVKMADLQHETRTGDRRSTKPE
jgi:hypothetical protein